MARNRKIIRTKRMYKKHTVNQKAVRITLFVLLLALLVGTGFIVMREWAKRFGANAPKHEPQLPSSSAYSSENASSETTSSEEQVKPPVSTNGAFLSAQILEQQQGSLWAEFFASASASGADTIFVELKDRGGLLHYKSENEMAKSYYAVTEQAVDISQLVAEIKNAGFTPAAVVNALRDTNAAHISNDNSYGYGEDAIYNWLDNSVALGGKSWLNPYMDNARSYIAGLASEIAAAGFELIVLEDVNFPDQYTVNINLMNENKGYAEILSQLINEVKQASGAEILVGYTNEQFVKTHENEYLVGVGELQTDSFVAIIDDNSIKRMGPVLEEGEVLTGTQKAEIGERYLAAIAQACKDKEVIIKFESNELYELLKGSLSGYGFNRVIR